VYTALAWRNKSFGSALEFAWSADSNEYAVREAGSKVRGEGAGLREVLREADARRPRPPPPAWRLPGSSRSAVSRRPPTPRAPSHPGPSRLPPRRELRTPQVKVFKNFQERAQLKIDFPIEGLHGGALIAARGAEFVCFYDWADGRLVRRIDVGAFGVFCWGVLAGGRGGR
jgi:hypothetical protein